MQLFSIYIHDDRYGVPTWRAIDLLPSSVTQFGLDLLFSSAHYQRVEIWSDATCVAAFGRPDSYQTAA